MLHFKGFLYTIIIAWTIYLLTVDFYSLVSLSYGHTHAVHIPFPGKPFNFYLLGIINVATLFIIGCINVFAKIKISESSILKKVEEEFLGQSEKKFQS